MTDLELLAPARDLETAKAAIDCGADAVYIGAGHHGARASAGNSLDDIKALCDYAHPFRVRVYVTVNTLVYENELDDVRNLVRELYRVGVDALIVQDMSLLMMDLPPIQLHASTQCDTRTPQKAAFLESVGFDQIVLPREMSLEEIRAVRAATTVPLEGFVHGALCVSYSGDCRASFVNGGRSANRGECAQICRLPYNLVHGNGAIIVQNRHLLSLRDMNRLAMLSQMADAGISSFKIEGRLKSVDYVRNVVSAYSQALDRVVADNPDRYRRASFGHSNPGFTPDVAKSFNRGFTSYFLTDTQPVKGTMASMLTPKHVGLPVGKVTDADKRSVTLDKNVGLNNGDGVGFFDNRERFIGFRINRVDGRRLLLASDLTAIPAPGTVLYRNFDKSFADAVNNSNIRRTIDVRMILDLTLNGISLTIEDERGCRATSGLEINPDSARTPQEDARRRTLDRTGHTIYRVSQVTDNLGPVFIPASALADLRRRTIEALDHTAAATRPLFLRRDAVDTAAPFPKHDLDMHDNVSNSLARRFYESHGANVKSTAVEVDPSATKGEVHVMTTRYCLRRELGLCLKTARGRDVCGPLKLVSVDNRTRPMRLEFDCRECRMHVIAT